MINLKQIPPHLPVLITGPTASGKSVLALEIARTTGGVIINADALQVFAGWPVLTAQPDASDMARATHLLYGHMGHDQDYSVGRWLRDVAQILADKSRPIITGGTGLYFRALTEGLADIPQIAPDIRARARQHIAQDGLAALLDGIDSQTRSRIDLQNPMRVARAWEVQQATGRGLADWQDQTPPPLMALQDCYPVVVNGAPAVLNARIEKRFDQMIRNGVLEEARAMAPDWDPGHLSSKAIGAASLIAHIRGEISLDQARMATLTASRQYAKRQRSWFRARMTGWNQMDVV